MSTAFVPVRRHRGALVRATARAGPRRHVRAASASASSLLAAGRPLPRQSRRLALVLCHLRRRDPRHAEPRRARHAPRSRVPRSVAGRSRALRRASGRKRAAAETWTVGRAMRTRAFWMLLATFWRHVGARLHPARPSRPAGARARHRPAARDDGDERARRRRPLRAPAHRRRLGPARTAPDPRGGPDLCRPRVRGLAAARRISERSTSAPSSSASPTATVSIMFPAMVADFFGRARAGQSRGRRSSRWPAPRRRSVRWPPDRSSIAAAATSRRSG